MWYKQFQAAIVRNEWVREKERNFIEFFFHWRFEFIKIPWQQIHYMSTEQMHDPIGNITETNEFLIKIMKIFLLDGKNEITLEREETNKLING